MRFSSIPLILCGILLLPVPSAAGTGFTLARFLEVPTLGSVAVSPDGRSVAYTWSHRDLEDDDRITRLWLGDVETGRTRQLTFTDDGVGGVSWRPDGALSYLRTHEENPQVWINPLDGSEPRPITAVAGGVGAYWWSPDGKWLAVLADPTEPEDPEDAEEADSQESEGQESEAEAAEAEAAEAQADTDPREALVYDVPEDRQDWTVFDRLEQPAEYQQIWIVPVGQDEPADEPAARRLTSAPWHPYHVAWSPDGSRLAITFNARFSSLVDEEQQIALMDVDSGGFEVITPLDRHSSMASFSPDGRSLAYFTDREADFRAYLNLKDVVVRDLESGAETVVTPGVTWTLAGFGSTPGEPARWDPKGSFLYLSAADGTDLDLIRIDVKKRTVEKLTDLEGSLFGLSLGGGSFAYLETALDRPGTLFAGKLGGKAREIDSTNGAVATYGLQPARKLRLPGHDGGLVEGYLFLPPGAGDADRLPAIIEMHGGPYSRYGNAWTNRYPWQVLSHSGFAVVIVNPRGGTGYGEDFLRGVYRNFGTDDYLDIMAAVDALVLQGTIDPDRLGFTGYSYGGLMTNTVVSRTDRFKAAVSIAGIWNYTSAMGQNNPQLFIDSYLRPWDEDLQRMWEHSPASRADLITTPTLIMHGKDDEPVDPRQSIEMFSYLQLNGVPSRLVLYPGEGHGINQPSHMIDYLTRELQWFRHYVLGEEDAVGAEEPAPVEP